MGAVWRVAASLVGALVAFAPRNAAAAPPSVHLEVAACEGLDSASVRRIFAADLGAPTTANTGPDVTEVSISCEGDSVVVRVKDPLSRKTVKRSFDPKSFGNQGESRLIAIAASELVLASWAELAENPKPKVPAEGAPARPDTLETARVVVKARAAKNQPGPEGDEAAPFAEAAEPTPGAPASADVGVSKQRAARGQEPLLSGRVMAVFSFRSFLRGDGTLYGGGARIGQEHTGVVSWAADALVENGRLSHHKVTSATLGAWLGFYFHRSVLTLRLGGGLRGGVLGVADGATVAAWGWPMLVSSLTLRFGPVAFDLGGEAGLVDLLLGNNDSLRGTWASGQAGLGFAL